MENYILSCDWGTSSFRLRLITRQDQQLVGETTSSNGIASTFNAWKTQGAGIDRSQFFREQLKTQIERLAETVGISLDTIPVIISGMASSSIGMTELPYATLPFPIDGSQATIKHFEEQFDFPNDIFLISGIRSEHDVMRGEETQLIGLLALLDTEQHPVQDRIILFPGTHSKHLYIQDGQLIDFRTFMTGEVFNLMSHYSILKDSVETHPSTSFSESDRNAFIAGVREANSDSLLSSLFKIRTNQLFAALSKPHNALYLSGLLIGTELKTLVNKPNYSLMLCSGPHVYEPYTLAMQTLNLSSRSIIVPADLLDKATIAGQVKIMQNQSVSSIYER